MQRDPLWFHRRACDQRAEGDLDGALATLDDGLAAVGLDPGAESTFALLLHTKAVTISLTGRHDEAHVLFHRVLELGEDKGNDSQWRLLRTHSRLGLALLLAERGEHADAEEALLNVAIDCVTDPDPTIQDVGSSALAYRLSELIELRDFDEVLFTWELLQNDHGASPAARAEIADAGKTAAAALLKAGRNREARATANEVIEHFRTETDPAITAAVAVAMLAGLMANLRSARLFGVWQDTRKLLQFLERNPEPEVIEAMCDASPYGAALVRRALGRKQGR